MIQVMHLYYTVTITYLSNIGTHIDTHRNTDTHTLTHTHTAQSNKAQQLIDQHLAVKGKYICSTYQNDRSDLQYIFFGMQNILHFMNLMLIFNIALSNLNPTRA